MTGKHSVHWFRKGLRIHDNPSFRHGVIGAKTFRCIFILDPWFANASNVGINKWRFLLQCLEDLDRTLMERYNSRLFVLRGQPADILPKLLKEWGTSCLTFEEDPEPFGRVRDQNITAMCKEMNISVISYVGHTLYKLENIIERNGGRAPLTYHQFQSVIASLDPPPQAEEPVTLKEMGDAKSPISEDHDEKYGVPTLEELGFDTKRLRPGVWQGGETEALDRLHRHLQRKGQTGFPWIDAIMTQLREEGWIHHLARHAVACFLTRGDLWISWEEGMKVFEELLLDADWSVNAGMWMWLSCSSFFQQFFHCYCPVRFGRKADPNGDYIRKYLPVLRNMPSKYIHEPWTCPESVQRAAKCTIGVDYPLPMLNHSIVSKQNIERMKQVYLQLMRYKHTGVLPPSNSISVKKGKPEESNNEENIFSLPKHAFKDFRHCCKNTSRKLENIPP